MRTILLAAFAMIAGPMSSVPAVGDQPTQAQAQTAPTQPAAAKAEPPAAVAEPAAVNLPKVEGEIDLPAGFKKMKRGKYTLYCRKETVMGTRFPAEKCYDEKGIRHYLLDQRENLRQVDKIRRICGNRDACGGGS